MLPVWGCFSWFDGKFGAGRFVFPTRKHPHVQSHVHEEMVFPVACPDWIAHVPDLKSNTYEIELDAIGANPWPNYPYL